MEEVHLRLRAQGGISHRPRVREMAGGEGEPDERPHGQGRDAQVGATRENRKREPRGAGRKRPAPFAWPAYLGRFQGGGVAGGGNRYGPAGDGRGGGGPFCGG